MNKRTLFICGSPSRKRSGSYQIARYAAHFLETEVDFIHIADLKLDPFVHLQSPPPDSLIESISNADLIVWTFGVHVGYVPAQMKLLLDSLLQTCSPDLFGGKLAAAICTSGRLHDSIAIKRVQMVSEYVGMQFIDSLSILGSSGLYYEEEEYSELLARRFAQTLNRAITAGFSAPGLPDPTKKPQMAPWKSNPSSRVLPEMRSKSNDHAQLMVVSAFNPSHDDWGSFWQEAVNRRSVADVATINLSDYQIRPCTACLLCNQFNHGDCVIPDDVQGLRQRLMDHRVFVVITPVSAWGENIFLKTFIDRLWVDIHQHGFASRHALIITYGGGDSTQPVAEYLKRWLTLMGIRCSGIIADTGDALDIDRILDFHLDQLHLASVESREIERNFDEISDRDGIRMLVNRWGHILREDYRYYIAHDHIPLRFRIPVLMRWWLFGTPWRFRNILKLGRWAARRRRQTRFDQSNFSEVTFKNGSRFTFDQ